MVILKAKFSSKLFVCGATVITNLYQQFHLKLIWSLDGVIVSMLASSFSSGRNFSLEYYIERQLYAHPNRLLLSSGVN